MKRIIKDSTMEDENSFKKNLTMQRELFKRAKLSDDYDLMLKSLENIKSDVKYKAIQKGLKSKIESVEKIIDWYSDIPNLYYRTTPSGNVSYFPIDKVKKNLSKGYELLVKVLDDINLL